MRKLIFLFVFLGAGLILYAQTSEKLSEEKAFRTGSGMTVLCKAGTSVELNKDGKVIACTPARDIAFVNAKNFKYVAAADYPVRLDDFGNFLSFRLKSNAIVENGQAEHYSALGGYDISFYPSGLVKEFVPKFPIEVRSIRGSYMAKAKEPVSFYENGYVKSFVPVSDIVIKDKQGKKHEINVGTRVELDASGYLKI